MRPIKEKLLFSMTVDGGEIGNKCIYNIKSGKIRIGLYTRSFYKHKKKPVKFISTKTSVCATLRQHAEQMKDDPERLSTEFMQKVIGVRCKS